MLRRIGLLVSLFFPALIGCSGDSDSGWYQQRDTLPSGVVRVRYSELPTERVYSLEPGLRLGAVEGDANLTFGDVRGVDADREGRIYVLDHLASEIRAFDSDGTFLHRVASKGEGPGELGRSNGMILVGDTILWVPDHSKWTMIGLSPDGEELARFPMHVLSRAYVWTGTFDNLGRFWKPDSHYGDGERYEAKEGVNEVSGRLFLKSFDTATNVVDSVYLGDDVGMSFVQKFGNGQTHYGIPFRPSRMTTVDPDGGFWQVHTSGYRLARLNEKGDTTLVVDVAMEPIPVEPEERTAHMERISERGQQFQRAADAVASLIPETKPLIQKLIVDDLGRLWVGREAAPGANPLYDVFDRDGEFLGSIQLNFKPDQFRPIRIRHGHVYAVVLDEWDVPSIVRAELPEALRSPEGG